jgi:peroxiredoxin
MPFVILAVDVGESRNTVEQFVRKKGLTLPFLLDEKTEVSSQYGVRSHPMKFLIDTQGDLTGIAYGYRKWDTKEMISLIRTLVDSA